MNVTYIYGPDGINNVKQRTTVYTFDEIPEPWKGYAMMLDAAYNGEVILDFGFCNRQQIRFDDNRRTVWYLFDIDFWREHADTNV